MGNEELSNLRHSAEHVLHQALLNLYPNDYLLPAMGPATEDGFYMDIDLPVNVEISDKDFPRIEAEMQKIINQNLPITRQEVSWDEAYKMFLENPYKLEWLEEIKNRHEKVTIYYTGEKFVDLCAGPHASSTGKIKAFKLLTVAGAYWHGNEKNKMLTRIYGTAFGSKEDLDDFLKRQEEAEKRDHRKLGKELGLFVFSDLIGKGLPTFSPKGATVKRELERFAIDEELKRGYYHVVTPDLAKVDLYKKSGHYPYYKDTMYPIMKVEEEELILKPMTCPHHFMFYKSQSHSYKELPYKMAEIAHQYRYEKSGELSGLTRVRMFCLADAHIICSSDQTKQVVKEVLDLIDFANQTFGMIKGADYRYRLSLGDKEDTKKYYKDDAAWDLAEKTLREVLTELKAPFFEAQNEAAFYGPKIDIQVKNASGKEETAFTVQYDFVMPERFDLTFINEKGNEERPVVIHRSSIGCLERTVAFLIEKYAGAFPVWLSPVQTVIIPIADRHANYAKEVEKKLKDANIRVEVDNRSETMQARLRDAQLQKVPYMLIAGDKEIESKTVAVRLRTGEKVNPLPIGDFISKARNLILTRSLLLW
jgi:threonyl-tRNA synthetase